jgi:hypothetical protein
VLISNYHDEYASFPYCSNTVVKELRSEMFRQHPGYHKAVHVFLKETQTIIVSFYEYILYIMFWIMMLYDCYYYYCHFCPNIIAFCSVKLDFFLKVNKESGIKIITINWNIAISCIYEWMKFCQTRQNINEWFILLRDIILLMKSHLVTTCSYSLKLDVNRCF